MKYVFTFLGMVTLLQVYGQLHDNMWVFKNADSLFFIDFRENPPYINQKDNYLELHTAKSVFCDKDGNLLYYTNCIQINNQIDSLLDNGGNLNPGYYANENNIPVFNAGFFLPAPNDSTRCYFIYMYPEHFAGLPPISTKVQFTLIDVTQNSGLGKVLEKNIPILIGGEYLYYDHAGAVRHANGRDWWILVPSRIEPKYYRVLLTPQGFSLPDSQEIGLELPSNDPNFYINYNLFSQDGSKYFDFQTKTGIFQYYDFDRCTGLLSNLVSIQTPHTLEWPNIKMSGFAVSPNGKKLYVSYANPTGAAHELKQYDLEAQDIQGSEQLIWSCDIPSQYECSAGQMLLAPNGKIYVQALIDTVAYHVIHHPDNDGASCGFDYGRLRFPSKYPQSEMPYFPNYRLGPLDGSACDTLGIDNHPLAGFHWEMADTMNPLQVQFTDNSFYEPTEWFWDFGGTGTSTEINPIYEFPFSGTYEVCLTVSNQFDSDTFCQNITLDSLPTSTIESELPSNVFFKISPNPANGEAMVDFFHLAQQHQYLLKLRSVTGAVLFQKKFQGSSGKFKVPLMELPSGMYFVELLDEGNVLGIEKLVVQQ